MLFNVKIENIRFVVTNFVFMHAQLQCNYELLFLYFCLNLFYIVQILKLIKVACAQ